MQNVNLLGGKTKESRGALPLGAWENLVGTGHSEQAADMVRWRLQSGQEEKEVLTAGAPAVSRLPPN